MHSIHTTGDLFLMKLEAYDLQDGVFIDCHNLKLAVVFLSAHDTVNSF